MEIEKKAYGRNQRQTLGDVIKGFGIMALGMGLLYTAAETKESLQPEDNYLQVRQYTNWSTANRDEFKEGIEKRAGDTLPYVIGGIGVLTMVAGVGRIVNKTYRP